MLARAFDALERIWLAPRTRRSLSALIVAAFIVALLVIEIRRRVLLPPGLARLIPASHFRAVELAFYLLLVVEVIGLVFALVRSLSNSVGKQFEILSLVLLRQSFEEFAVLQEPLTWAEVRGRIPAILSDAVGALLVFVLVEVYYRLQRHQALSGDLHDRHAFIAAKKAIALGLLLAFTGLCVRAVVAGPGQDAAHGVFVSFYTVLVFSDILMVLISMRYSSNYRQVFRNSGLAVATVLLRLSLSAPAFYNAALAVASAAFAVALTLAYNLHADRSAPA